MANALEMLLRIALRKEGVDSGLRETRQGVRDLGDSAQGASATTTRLGGGLGSLTKTAAGLAAGLLGGAGLIAGLKASVSASTDFGGKIAEVSTLLDDTSGLDALTAKTRDLAREFGNAPTEQAQALYNIISAGASDSADAMRLLTDANKLALGGVTDVNTAADGLTSILNAYGMEAGQSTRISDGLFAAMRAGKTTIGELSSSLGQVTPIAAQAGVSFEEVAAATATLTKGGVSTSQAVTQLRGIISSVLKPTSEAAKQAEELGLQFDVQALKAQGLSGFLQAVADKTGGNTEQMAILFSQVEALGGALSLTGTQANDFGAVLDSVENSAGETDKAVAKIAGDDRSSLRRFGSAMTDIGITAGGLIAKALVPLADAATNIVNEFNDSAQSSDDLGESVSAAAAKIEPALQIIVGSAQALGGGLRAFFNLVQITVASVLQFVVDKVAVAAEALSQVTFGDLSDDLERHAALMRQTSADLGERIQGDLGDIAEAGETVRSGFARAAEGVSSLGAGADSASPKVQALSADTRSAGDAAGITAEQLDALGDTAEVAGGRVVDSAADAGSAVENLGGQGEQASNKLVEGATSAASAIDDVGDAATDAGKKVKSVGDAAGLTVEQFDALGDGAEVAGGRVVDSAADAGSAVENLGGQGEQASNKLVEGATSAASAIDDVGNAATDAGKKVEALGPTAADVEQAYQTLGITSSATLKQQAQEAREAAEAIRASGAPLADQEKAWLAVLEAELKAADAAGDEFAVKVIAANAKALPGTENFRVKVREIADKYVEVGEAATDAGQQAADGAKKATDALEPWRQKIVDVQNAAREAAAEAAKVYDVSDHDPRAIPDRTTSTAGSSLPAAANLLTGDDRDILQLLAAQLQKQQLQDIYSRNRGVNTGSLSGASADASQRIVNELETLTRKLAGGGASAEAARKSIYRQLGIPYTSPGSSSGGSVTIDYPTTPGTGGGGNPIQLPSTGGTVDLSSAVSVLQSIDRRLQIISGQIDDAVRGQYRPSSSVSAADILRELERSAGVSS
ncbi:phage tail tape measure protein [Algiphilus sp. W345]|uniref:Phage tail tape measure protein n=1 Tax=Banduia mediterranea TaxID=3075609 RepID=A0ABU2WFX4_9GAMM|nr:phage tail tape measure protein [Algiphilus sp. W345]MDT0496529.1 phage tail tape measure protein [Algiphilus sp. W345]